MVIIILAYRMVCYDEDYVEEQILRFWDGIEIILCADKGMGWKHSTKVIQIHMILRAWKMARWIVTKVVFSKLLYLDDCNIMFGVLLLNCSVKLRSFHHLWLFMRWKKIVSEITVNWWERCHLAALISLSLYLINASSWQ